MKSNNFLIFKYIDRFTTFFSVEKNIPNHFCSDQIWGYPSLTRREEPKFVWEENCGFDWDKEGHPLHGLCTGVWVDMHTSLRLCLLSVMYLVLCLSGAELNWFFAQMDYRLGKTSAACSFRVQIWRTRFQVRRTADFLWKILNLIVASI